MSTKYEYYDTGLDSNMAVFPPYYEAQTFTVNIPHKISAVKLEVARLLGGEPGTVIVQIRTTDGNGKPTSTVLCSGSFNGNDVNEGSFEWVEISLSETILSASIKYAIVMMAPDADNTQPIYWANDYSSPTYSGGSRVYSEDEGDTWIIDTSIDYMFEEWGTAFFQQSTGQGAITPVGVLGAHIIWYQNVGQGAVAITGTLGWKIALTVGSGAVTPTGSLLYRLGRNIQITVITTTYRSVNVITALYRKITGSTTET